MNVVFAHFLISQLFHFSYILNLVSFVQTIRINFGRGVWGLVIERWAKGHYIVESVRPIITMSYRREQLSSRASLFDIEEGGLRTSSSHSHKINEQDNDKAIESLQDRVVFLKRLTGDIHEEVENHNRFLDKMGNAMDASRGIMSGTMDRLKMVFEKKSNRRMCKLVASFVISFILIYYIIRFLEYSMHG